MNYDDTLIFTNEPLPSSNTTVTLPIFSEEDALRGSNLRGTSLPRRRLLEGQITLDPAGRIFFIPPFDSTPGEPVLMPDRGTWDLYLIYLPFTLHPAPTHAFYEEVTFFIDLTTAGAKAYDLFPTSISSEVEETKIYTLSPQYTFREIGVNTGHIGRPLQFKGLHPIITAFFGENDREFYWIHEGFKQQKAVLPETKHAAVILQVPRGTHQVEGSLHYSVNIVKKIAGVFRQKDGRVDTFPFHWDVQNAPSLFKIEMPQNQQSVIDTEAYRPIVSPSITTHFDVCLFCALPEEAHFAIQEIERLCNVTFQFATSSRSGVYRYATIQNRQGKPVTLRVSSQLKAGPLEAGLHIRPVLEECTPYFVAMTGICAGDKRKVKLGDLVLASSAFSYDIGKVVIGRDGKPQLLRELDTWHASLDVLQFAHIFRGWQAAITDIARPETVGEKYLLQLHIAPVASGNTVRGDNPFEEICLFMRNTVAIDMEAAAFYRTVAGFPGLHALFVKGITDYADGDKNDLYHEYASTVSAAYMVRFIQEFVTGQLLSRS